MESAVQVIVVQVMKRATVRWWSSWTTRVLKPLCTLAVVGLPALPALGVPSTPLHEAGELLAESSTWTLHAHYQRFCRLDVPYPRAIAVLVFKDPSARVSDPEKYRKFFEQQLLPAIRRHCPAKIDITIEHYLEGVRMVSYDGSVQTGPEIEALGGDGEASFGQAYASFDESGQLLEVSLGGWSSLQERSAVFAAANDRAARRQAEEDARQDAEQQRRSAFFFPEERGRDVLVCNRGALDIAVAALVTYSAPLTGMKNWTYASWTLINARTCKGVSEGNVYTNLVFAIVDPDYRFGVVHYTVSDPSGDIGNNKIVSFCVSDKLVLESGTGTPDRYLPPCAPGFFAAPTSATSRIETWGTGRAQITIDVTPTASDRIVVAISKGRRVAW